MMTKFREHRGSLADSMETVVYMSTMRELKDYFRKQFEIFDFEFPFDKIKIRPYGYDKRIDWDTHIVTIPDYGVLGWTDGLPSDYSPVA